MINFSKAAFIMGVPNLELCPPDIGFEVAFVGRSNSGKSSALNTLVNKTGLARTSKTPGRTQCINFFELSPDARLVDLPGYGYAQVSPDIKKQIEKILSSYLSLRQCLKGLIILMDIRHPLTPADQTLLDFTLNLQIPLHILLTKADKLNKGPASAALNSVKKTLEPYKGRVSIQLFSSLKKQGVEEARQHISQWLSEPVEITIDEQSSNI